MSDNDDTSLDDDWGAAIAEQAKAEAEALQNQAQSQAATAAVFKDFSKQPSKIETHNDIDFILDIPVQLTVELGRT
jgi:flagellar motor switch protein FliN/FliY